MPFIVLCQNVIYSTSEIAVFCAIKLYGISAGQTTTLPLARKATKPRSCVRYVVYRPPLSLIIINPLLCGV